MVPWGDAEVIAALPEFLPHFHRRPIRDNQGGMRSVGLFNVWFLLTRLRPDSVIESGVWKGQSTWLIEDTLPNAKIFSIDPNLSLREYVSGRARYSQTDFLGQDLHAMGFRYPETLAFFDDHQDVLPRLELCRMQGIRHVILDDNYPEFAGARHVSAAAILNDRNGDGTPKYPGERKSLLEMTESYYLCKPIFDYREPLTMEKSLISEPSLLGPFDSGRHSGLETYFQDMPEYRWTTYLKLKSQSGRSA